MNRLRISGRIVESEESEAAHARDRETRVGIDEACEKLVDFGPKDSHEARDGIPVRRSDVSSVSSDITAFVLTLLPEMRYY